MLYDFHTVPRFEVPTIILLVVFVLQYMCDCSKYHGVMFVAANIIQSHRDISDLSSTIAVDEHSLPHQVTGPGAF
jgi:hypothetical protein